MSAYLLLVIVFSALWLFWVALGSLFDAITDYHAKARAAERSSAEAVSATKGTVTSALQSRYSSQHSSQHPQHPRTTSRS